MEEKLYCIKNCDTIEKWFDNEEDMKAEYKKLVADESRYRYTHYYYSTKTMTRGEYVCKCICSKPVREMSVARFVADDEDKIQALFKVNMRLECKKCPFKKYSEYGGEK